MAFGTFTLVIDGERQDGTPETKARLYLRPQGVDTLVDAEADEFKFPAQFADPDGISISLPYTLTLFTDSTSGESTSIGYEGHVATDYGHVDFQIAAQEADTTRALADLTDVVLVPISSTQAYRDEAEAAQVAAETAAAAAADTASMLGTGRLSDAVLTSRFEQSKVFIPATQMMSAAGSPGLNGRGGFWPVWLLDATTAEGVSCAFTVPQSWAKFDIVVKGLNASTGTGNVVLRVLYTVRGDGDDVTTGFTTGTDTTFTAGAQNIRQTIATTRTNLTADSTKTHVVRVMRQAADAGDTLANDYGISAIELIPTQWVNYIPPSIEEPDAPIVGGANAFTKADNASLAGLRVFQQAPPPANDTVDTTYAYWPVTDATTSQNFNTSTWTGGNRWSFLWANRCNFGAAWNKKPNPLPSPSVSVGGRQCRAVFTTIDRANAATQCQVRYLLGNDATSYQAPWLAVGGSTGDFVTDAAFRASPATYCTTEFPSGSTIYKVMTDKVLLPAPRLVDGTHPELQPGIVLDYEVQDSRTPAITQAFMTALATDIHAASRQLFVFTNPFNAATQQYTGFDATNLPTVLAAVDYLTVFLWSGNVEGSISTSYTNQLAMLGTLTATEYAKLVINFELGNPGTTLADAQWVHGKLREAGTSHPTKVMFWRNFATQGGPATTLTNQKIAAVIAP